MSATLQCPACGKQSGPYDRHCGGCGARLPTQPELAPTEIQPMAAPDQDAPPSRPAVPASHPTTAPVERPAADRKTAAAPASPTGYLLAISQPNQPERMVPLRGNRWTIGRGTGCDIVIDAPSISRQHAVLERDGDRFVLNDQDSANGLYVGGLRSGRVEMTVGESVRVPDPFGNLLTITLWSRSLPDHPPDEAAALSGPSHTIPLGSSFTGLAVGRDDANDVRIDLPLVSRRHARLERDGSEMIVRDLDSSNGTFVNGERVVATRPLHPGDELSFGPARFLYEGTALRRFVEQPKVRIDAVNLVRRAGAAVLLDTVSLSIQPGEFVALIGGSGAGKSTLMNALCGAIPAESGLVLFNGQDFYRSPGPYREMIGYVPQDDILHRDLPVGRALDYAAQLRLPPDTSAEERRRRVDEALAEVRMEGYREQVINRLSGGQRKRVSIAAELLAQPSVLFLDEPTSGLDPGLDKTVMGMLRLLCDKGRTIIMVTHATENIGLCTLVAFMARGGRLAYFGPPNEAPPFFEVTAMPDVYTLLEQDRGATERADRQFQESALYRQYVLARRHEAAALTVGAATPAAPSRPDRGDGMRQWRILSRRYGELMWRDRWNLIILLAQAPVVGLLLLLVVSSNSFTPAGLAGSQQVLLMLTLAAIWFGTINAAREIVKERAIYLRERLATLRIWPYVLSKFGVLAGLCIGQSLVLLGIVTLKTPHLPAHGLLLPTWFEMAITLILTSLAGLAGGLLLSSLVVSADRAMSIVPIVLLAEVVFCGGVFDLNGASSWLARLFVSRWCLGALGQTIGLNALAAHAHLPDWPKTLYGGRSAEHLLERWAILVGWTILFLFGTYWSLRGKDRGTR